MPLAIVNLSAVFAQLKYEIIYCIWYKVPSLLNRVTTIGKTGKTVSTAIGTLKMGAIKGAPKIAEDWAHLSGILRQSAKGNTNPKK